MVYQRISRHVFRGPQPGYNDLVRLQQQGLKAVFNLRDESVESRALALSLGLNYHHIRVRDWHHPTESQVEEFLELLFSPGWAPALVHCWGGVGRTGIFVSCYRIRHHGWEVEQALSKSDEETPHLIMSELQRDWLRQWSRGVGKLECDR